MQKRGRHGQMRLYEVCADDLADNAAAAGYSPGNILLFAADSKPELGAELAKADDLAATLEFLGVAGYEPESPEGPALENYAGQRGIGAQGGGAQGLGGQGGEAGHDEVRDNTAPSASEPENQRLKANIRELAERIEQREGLLTDLSETLKSQRQENEILRAMLDESSTELAVNRLTRQELANDLQEASANSLTVETALERVLEEKYQLEQEVALHITDLVELNLENSDLRARLDDLAAAPSATPPAARPSQLTDGQLAAGPTGQTSFEEDGNDTTMVLPSGKQIIVRHEFPETQSSKSQRSGSKALAFLRIVLLILLGAVLMAFVSIAATALINGISLREALDLVFGAFGLGGR